MILINITMPIRPDKMDEWLALADSYAKDVNSEDGCLFFQFARSLANENEFVCIEGFKDAQAGATHVKQPYVKRFFETAPDLVSGSRRSSTSIRPMTASVRWARSSPADRQRQSAGPDRKLSRRSSATIKRKPSWLYGRCSSSSLSGRQHRGRWPRRLGVR